MRIRIARTIGYDFLQKNGAVGIIFRYDEYASFIKMVCSFTVYHFSVWEHDPAALFF